MSSATRPEPWHRIIRLKDELWTGELSLAEFAADLHEVVLAQGRRPVYEDPEKFFALTYSPTRFGSWSGMSPCVSPGAARGIPAHAGYSAHPRHRVARGGVVGREPVGRSGDTAHPARRDQRLGRGARARGRRHFGEDRRAGNRLGATARNRARQDAADSGRAARAAGRTRSGAGGGRRLPALPAHRPQGEHPGPRALVRRRRAGCHRGACAAERCCRRSVGSGIRISVPMHPIFALLSRKQAQNCRSGVALSRRNFLRRRLRAGERPGALARDLVVSRRRRCRSRSGRAAEVLAARQSTESQADA